MKNLILVSLVLSFCVGMSVAQAQPRTPDFKVKKSTDVVKHRAYQSIFKANYDGLQGLLTDSLAEMGCTFKLSLKSLRKEGVFSDGEFIGSFETSCYNQNIKDMNLYFQVYPYDEETESVLEIVDMAGKSIKISNCWRHDGKMIKCDPRIENLNRSEYNFKNIIQ